LNKSPSGKVERLINLFTIMKKILFALTMLALAVSALPQARGADMSIDFIYDNLSGGNWIDAEGYGYGWQPDVATSDPNWRPYSDGYWAYTDYGWTWISYEDFGWATYHYGRWANLADYGWVWFPGEDLDWGPAWVSWRTGGDYIGWAPLPPRGPGVVYEGQPIGANVDIEFGIGPEYYNFCDVRFIGEPVLRDRIFPPVQNVTYITNTVNVTNITVQNNVVYNYGPKLDVVNQYSSRPIQQLTIQRETPANLSTAVKSGTLTKVQGNKLLVGAPLKIAAAAPAAKPPAVKAKVAQPRFERGWKNVPNRAEVEQRIKTENPKNVPPPTRAAAREGGGPASGAAATSPGPRGRQGRVAPGETAAPSLGASPAPFERGKAGAGGRPRPGATAMPGEGAERVSPQPFEQGKPGGRGRPGMTPPATGPREGLSPAPFERGQGRGKAGERSPGQAEAGRPAGAENSPPPSAFERAPQSQPERGRPPGRRPGEEPNAGQGAPEPVPAQNRERGPERQRFGTPAPMGAGEQGQPVTPPSGGTGGQARTLKNRTKSNQSNERTQSVPGQPPTPQHGGAPAPAEHHQGQPEGGKQKAPKETPPPRPQ
jgi:hypothetical protein